MVNIFDSFRHWRNRRIARGQLARMNDRMLEDIGIIRGDIDHVVRGLHRT